MPIEVNELIIKAVVQDQKGKGGGQAAPNDDFKDEVIMAAVEQVLRILKSKKDR